MRPAAIGYLRTDISGCSQPWHETQMRSRASRLGYDYCKTIAFSEVTDDPITRLTRWARRAAVDAVIVPSLEHLGGEVPHDLLMCADVITVSPQAHHTRDLVGDSEPLFPSKVRGGDTQVAEIQRPGPDGNAGAMGGNSSDQALFEAMHGVGGFSSPKASRKTFDQPEMQ